jgi:hypothetical protein
MIRHDGHFIATKVIGCHHQPDGSVSPSFDRAIGLDILDAWAAIERLIPEFGPSRAYRLIVNV